MRRVPFLLCLMASVALGARGQAPPRPVRAARTVVQGIVARALAVDTEGRLYIIAAGDPQTANRVLVLRPASAPARQGEPARLGEPLSANSDGHAFQPGVSEASLTIAPFVGNGARGSLGDGGAATSAQLDLETRSPFFRSGMVADGAGNLFLADTGNATVRRVAGPLSTEPGVVRGVAGRWGPMATAELREPLGLALDRAGNLYIADRAANSVFVLRAATGELARLARLGELAHVATPTAVAADPAGGTLFVGASGRVFAVDLRGGGVSMVAEASPVAPSEQGGPGGDGKPAPAGPLATPSQRGIVSGLAVDAAGNLFFSDAANNVIRRLDARVLRPERIYGTRTGQFAPASQPGEAGQLSVAAGEVFAAANDAAMPAVRVSLREPGDIVFDAQGDLFIADQGHARILEIPRLGPASSGVTLSPASMDFGNQPLGGATAPGTFTLTNNNSGTLSGISIGFTGANPADFSQTNSCGPTLNPLSSCSINVRFAPQAAGARSATLTVTDSDPSSPQTASVSGTGDDFQLVAASNGSTSLTIDSGATATFNLQVTPDAVFSGAVTLACPVFLPPASTCTVNPNPVNVTAGTPATFSVAIATTKHNLAPIREQPARPGKPASRFPARLGGPAPLALLFVLAALAGAFARRRAPRRIAARRCASALALLAALAALAGCKRASTKIPTGTTAGTYTFSITGTSQNAARAVTLTLTVK